MARNRYRSSLARGHRSRRLAFERLDPRLVLAADIFTAASELGVIVESSGQRTTFRELAIETHAADVDVAASQFLDAHHQALGLPADVTDHLQLIETKHGLASSHVRFVQTMNDIPVHERFVSVHFDGQGTIQTVHNAYQALTVPADASPAIALSDAVTVAERAAEIETPRGLDARGELVWVANKDQTGELAWRVTVYGLQPIGDFMTLIDADTSRVLSQENIAAFDTGTGDVFEPNPYQTQGNGSGMVDNNDANNAQLTNQLISVSLQGLNSGTGKLIGEYADLATLNSTSLPDVDANEPSRIYEYTRDDPRFEQVVVYHSIDSIQRYFHTLGFDDDTGTPNGIRDFPSLANAHWYSPDQSFYSTGNDAVHFGDGGVDDGEDADIVAHEYGHAVQHDQNTFWGGGEMGAMGEGFGDYLAASFYADFGDPTFQAQHAAAVGEWDAVSYSSANPPNLRRVDGNKHYPEDLVGQVHADGEIWSAALWDMRNALGGPTADQLVLESHFSLPGGASMRDGALGILQADANLNGGANATIIEQVFDDRGILADLPPDDHGNGPGEATPFVVGSTVSANIEYGADEDWFSFGVPANAHIVMSTVIGVDTVLALYAPDGFTQLEFDDDGGPGLASRIAYTIPSTGVYFAEVGSYSSNTGPYDLTITSDATLGGDFDGNGVYECADINALVAEIVAGTNNPIYDLTADGNVDLADRDAWLAEAGAVNLTSGNSYLLGDANLDGFVDGTDFVAWNDNKFTQLAAWCAGDFDANGFVDGADFIIWNSNKFTGADGLVAAGDGVLNNDVDRLGGTQPRVTENKGTLVVKEQINPLPSSPMRYEMTSFTSERYGYGVRPDTDLHDDASENTLRHIDAVFAAEHAGLRTDIA